MFIDDFRKVNESFVRQHEDKLRSIAQKALETSPQMKTEEATPDNFLKWMESLPASKDPSTEKEYNKRMRVISSAAGVLRTKELDKLSDIIEMVLEYKTSPMNAMTLAKKVKEANPKTIWEVCCACPSLIV